MNPIKREGMTLVATFPEPVLAMQPFEDGRIFVRTESADYVVGLSGDKTVVIAPMETWQ